MCWSKGFSDFSRSKLARHFRNQRGPGCSFGEHSSVALGFNNEQLDKRKLQKYVLKFLFQPMGEKFSLLYQESHI